MARPQKSIDLKVGAVENGLMVGMMVMWLQNSEKFRMPSRSAWRIVSAVDGIVVSNSEPEEDNLLFRMQARDFECIEG
jgi:hypothetical protein